MEKDTNKDDKAKTIEENDKNKVEGEGKEEGAEVPKEEEKEMVIMKKGDYSVHVLIEEVKNCISVEEDKQPYPIVKVTCLGKSKRTEKTAIGCNDYTFGEHFYFEKTNLTAEMLDSEKIIVEVYDAKNTKKKDYFGIHEFDFEYIYNRPDHALHNFWLALANPESKEITQVRGYLKLSISVLHENDPRVQLEMKESEGTDCVVPAQIKMEYKQISFYFYRGEELPDMDSFMFEKKVDRQCDGYIEVRYMGITRKTKIVKMKRELIEWNQIVDIPVSVPAVSQKIVLIVKDSDVGKDDLVGSIEIKVDDILIHNKYENLTYLNIYGSSLNKRGKIYDQMNYNAEIGSKWKGRILCKIVANPVDAPIAQVRDIEDEEHLKEVYSKGRSNLWSVYFHLYSTYFLPEEKGTYGIRLSLQDNFEYLKPRKAEGRSIEWNTSGSLQCYTLTDNINELPDLFLYLTDKEGKYNICFQRIKASEFSLNNDIMVIKLLPDPCVKKVKNIMMSGLVKIQIGIANKVKNPEYTFQKPLGLIDDDDDDLEKHEELERKMTLAQEKIKSYTIVAVVYMSKELIAADSDGTSDPYVVLTLGKTEKKTSIKNNTVNGIWNEKLEFSNVVFNLEDKSTWPVFLLNVMDHNKILSNVCIGYNYLWLSNAAYTLNDTQLVRPRWHNLFLPKSNKQQGKIMLSFYIFGKEFSHLINQINYFPETMPFSCEINILGLRQLKPLSVFPVKKAFIKFDMNSLNVTGKQEDALQPIITVPGDPGENPTINTVIKFDVKLPKDDIFIPDLQCEVYDHLLSGMMNSLLGVFTIDVKKIIKKTNLQIEQDLKITKRKFGVYLTGNIIKKNLFAGLGQGPKVVDPLNQEKEDEKEDLNVQPLEIVQKDNKKDKEPLISLGKTEEEHVLPPSPEESKDHVIEIEPEKKINIPPGENISMEDKQSSSNLIPNEQGNQGQSTSAVNLNLNPNQNQDPNLNPNEPVMEKPVINGGVVLSKEFLKQNEHNSQFFVVYPVFKYFKIPGFKEGEGDKKVQKELIIEDESKAPDSSTFFKVGYILKAQENQKPEESTKHYRRIYREPLENVKELKLKSPFNKAKIRRGKYEDKTNETGLFDALSNVHAKILARFNIGPPLDLPKDKPEDRKSVSSLSSLPSQEGFMGNNSDISEKYYGKFKGLIRICEKKKFDDYQKTIKETMEKNGELIQDFKNLNKYEKIRKQILSRTSVIIRIYVLELNNLAKRDLMSESDPYIKLFLGKDEIINEVKIHQDDQKNCKWYKYYDIPAEIPGSSTLTLEVWDYDDLLSDDLIGTTTIDLEDRFFDSTWQELVHKPIEVRPLLHPDISGSQGEAYMWIDMFESSLRSEKIPWSIQPEPITHLEMRFVVWETEGMEMMDVEGTSDIYVIGYVDMKNKQSTDVHFRCQTGVGSFNWRMLLPIEVPNSPNTLTIQVYDNDLFSSDDYICGATINIKSLVTIPKYLDLPIKFTRQYYNDLSPEEKQMYTGIEWEDPKEDPEGIKFWVQCYKAGKAGGRVMCSLEILPQWKADLNKVGKGREEPNLDPYLPPPVGRFEWSLNPFKLLNQCVGPKFRRKMYCFICCCLLAIYLSCVIPYVIWHLSGEAVNPFNWKNLISRKKNTTI